MKVDVEKLMSGLILLHKVSQRRRGRQTEALERHGALESAFILNLPLKKCAPHTHTPTPTHTKTH